MEEALLTMSLLILVMDHEVSVYKKEYMELLQSLACEIQSRSSEY